MNCYKFLCAVFLLSAVSVFAQSSHYLDCTSGDDSHDGLSKKTAWKTVDKANTFVLQPGDSLLLRRGAVCSGMLSPKGSGSEGNPIRLGAYGTGELPQVIGTGQEAAVRFFDQQFWEVEDLNLTGGSPYGIYVGGTVPQLSHIHIRDLVVHDVSGQPKRKESGLLVIAPSSGSQTVFNDILVDGVTAWGTTQWGGIFINGTSYSNTGDVRGTNITIRNSVVHDVGGDGIFVGVARGVLMERNVVWNGGMQYTESIGTPDAIWEWKCEQCRVQYNEGFFSDSPGVDGGIFDIDFGNVDNTVQYNFGHDSQGYCVSIFGAKGESGFSRNSVIRSNLCVNNGRSPRLAQRQGALYLDTWDGGKLSGVQIYDNTIYWNPPLDTAAIVSEADIETGSPRFLRNNVIVSTVPSLLRSDADLDLSGNVYWDPLHSVPAWTYGKIVYHDLVALRAETGQETDSHYANPRLDDLLQPAAGIAAAVFHHSCVPDVYDQTASGTYCGPGALFAATSPPSSRQLASPPASIGDHPYHPTGWTLLALLTPEGHPGSDPSRSQVVVLQSMIQQFSALGLHVDAVPAFSITESEATNWVADWNFGSVRLLTPNSSALPNWWRSGSSTGLVLISPQHTVVRSWSGLVSFPEVELTLRSLMGTPFGMQPISFLPQHDSSIHAEENGR